MSDDLKKVQESIDKRLAVGQKKLRYLEVLAKRVTWNDKHQADRTKSIEDIAEKDGHLDLYLGGMITGETNLARLLLNPKAWEDDNDEG